MVGEESTHLSLEDLNSLIDTLYEGVSLSDNSGKIIRVNASLGRVTGLSPQVFLNQPMMSLYERGYFAKVPISCGALRERKVKHGIQEISTGKRVMATATPVLDSSGALRNVVVIARELSDLKSVEEGVKDVKHSSAPDRSEFVQALRDGIYGPDIVVRSEAMDRVLEKALAVAATDATVLLMGESGVGKDIVAEIIHRASLRPEKGPFFMVDCNAIPRGLAESEVFGYEKGAFTGADGNGKPGILEMAQGGTLFLDEISDLPLDVQGKFLRLLEKRNYRRLGGKKNIDINVRFITATNRDLLKMVERGLFRRDLYYRLNVVPIFIPPLREREEDILALLGFYLSRFNKKYKTSKRLSEESLGLLQSYHWPGNVRELVNLMEHLVITVPHDLIQPTDLTIVENSPHTKDWRGGASVSLKRSLGELEKNILLRAKKEHSSSRRVAKALGLSHTAVLKKIRKYGLDGK